MAYVGAYLQLCALIVIFICTDIDECRIETHNCDLNADCNDTVGSFLCTCNTGYEGTGSVCTSEENNITIDIPSPVYRNPINPHNIWFYTKLGPKKPYQFLGLFVCYRLYRVIDCKLITCW